MITPERTRLYVIPLGFIENDVALNLLLHNQAAPVICGCTSDDVQYDIEQRYRRAEDKPPHPIA